MGKAKELLDLLQKSEKELFPDKFLKSDLLVKDIKTIENDIGFKLPKSYSDFLRTYQVPTAKVYICFCGDSFANSFMESFSRKENKFVEAEDGEDVVVVMDWFNYDVSSEAAYLKSFHDRHDGMSAWAEAGFIYLGEFNGYQLFLDLKKGNVSTIYHEDMYESEDYDDPKAARDCMDKYAHLLCEDFDAFLELVCTGKPYDEDEHCFYDSDKDNAEEPVQNASEIKELTNCIIRTGKASNTPIKGQDKFGGYPTYLPSVIPADKPKTWPKQFLMEVYNHGFGDSDIICWQFYTDKAFSEFEIVEIHKGAALYDEASCQIRKWRWLHEFPIIYEPVDPKKFEEKDSRIGGKIPKNAKNKFKRKNINYLGAIYEHYIADQEITPVDYCVLVFGFDENGKMYAEHFQ